MRLADLKRQRDFPSMAIVSGALYIIGGTAEYAPLQDVQALPFEKYDVDTNAWLDVGQSDYAENTRSSAVGYGGDRIAVFDDSGMTVFSLDHGGGRVSSRSNDQHFFDAGNWAQACAIPCVHWVPP